MRFSSIMFFVLGVLMVFPTIVNDIQFDIKCGDRMKSASNSNTIELAIAEMEVVVKYLEDNKITSGYTSVFYNTPDEDIEFFYKNMKSSLEELKALPKDISQLEKSNVLMKLRESLTKETEYGTKIDMPSSLYNYPNNGFLGFLAILDGIECFGYFRFFSFINIIA